MSEAPGKAPPEDDPRSDLTELLRPSRINAIPAAASETGRRARFELKAARRAAAATEGSLEPPSSEELLFTVLELNRTVSVEMFDEAIVHRYVEALRRLFPRRRFAVRLLDPTRPRSGFRLVHATDRLADEARERLVISEIALARHAIAPEYIEALGATVRLEYPSLFEVPGPGFDIPLTAGGEFAGVLSVEYEPDLEEPSFDRSLIVPLAVQLAGALRNARLLRESNSLRDHLEKLLDHANAPIVVIGRDRKLRVVNRAFLALTGRVREELLGRDFVTLLPEPERARLTPVLLRALRGEATTNFEVRVERRSGGLARLSINTASILASDGRVEGVITIGRDLTEVRELEEQVIQAEKLATLGQLAAGVVHEINNPLTSISVYGEYLLRKGRQTGADPGDLDKLGRIVDSADRILKFTRDLITYARPSSGDAALVAIRDVLEQSLSFCEHLVADARAHVVRRCEDAGAVVHAVKGQLHQVFINLITNACHALPESDGEIVLATFVGDDDHVHVRVEDNGSGIPPQQRARVFEPFFSTKGEGKGTGLGLSIVRNIVQQHGGTIEVLDREGGGTCLEIRLPRPTAS